MKKPYTHQEFVSKIQHDNFTFITEYQQYNKPIKVKCKKCGIITNKYPSLILQGSCRECLSIKGLNDIFQARKTHEQFLKEATIVHGNNFSYPEEYKGYSKKILIKCNLCNTLTHTTPSIHLRRVKCKNCVLISQTKTIEQFENECKKIHDDRYEYFQDYKTAKQKIKVKCKQCETIFYQRSGSHWEGYGCLKCSSSKGELKIRYFLEKHNINYIYEHSFPDCKNTRVLSFDFYVPKYNTCIEYDGIQHFEPIPHWGGNARFNQIKISDNIKNEYCMNNDIRLIRISYKDKDSIVSILEKYFTELS